LWSVLGLLIRAMQGRISQLQRAALGGINA